MNPLVESRFKRTLISCPVCDKPIGERQGNKWWFLTGNKMQFGKVPVTMGQNSITDSYRMGCPDKKCKGGHIFGWVNE